MATLLQLLKRQEEITESLKGMDLDSDLSVNLHAELEDITIKLNLLSDHISCK